MASLLLFFCGRKAFQATFATALVLLSLALAVWAFTAPASWNEDELRALRAFRDEKKVELAAAVLDTGYEVAPPCNDWNAMPCKSTFGMERVERYCADENAMFIPDFSASINVSDGNQSTDTKRRLDNGCNGTFLPWVRVKVTLPGTEQPAIRCAYKYGTRANSWTDDWVVVNDLIQLHGMHKVTVAWTPAADKKTCVVGLESLSNLVTQREKELEFSDKLRLALYVPLLVSLLYCGCVFWASQDAEFGPPTEMHLDTIEEEDEQDLEEEDDERAPLNCCSRRTIVMARS